MATPKQIEANRRNAQSSTGPRTAAGRSASRMNALKSGIDAKSQIIRGESPAAQESLTAEYYSRFRPATPEQRFLADTLINSDWLLRRFRTVEAQLWEKEFLDDDGQYDPKTAKGITFVREHEAFLHLQRRIDSAGRAYHRALRALERLQGSGSQAAASSKTPQTASESPTQPASVASNTHTNRQQPSPIGFVPSDPHSAPSSLPAAERPLDPPPFPAPLASILFT